MNSLLSLTRLLRVRTLLLAFVLGLVLILIVFFVHHEVQVNEEKEWEGLFPVTIPPWPFNMDLNGPSVTMEDPTLVAYLQEKFLLSPPSNNTPLNLTSPWLFDTSMGQAAQIREVLKDMRNGFFIECGALDGETRSNSLVFERVLGWSGLLIEADPLNFNEAVHKRRKAYMSPTCLSIKPYPTVVSFRQARNVGKISEWPVGGRHPNHVDVQCFPLFTYLLALNRTTVDYFSLDVEGFELEVLETVPWDKVDIRTLSVEFIHGKRGKDVLRAYMWEKGYVVHSEVTHFNNLANDFIFVKKDLASS